MKLFEKMKIFGKKIAEEKSRAVQLGGEVLMPLADNRLKVSSILNVGEGQQLVFAVRGKVADCLGQGEHIVDSTGLPQTFLLLNKFFKLNAKNPPSYIYTEGYFLNLQNVKIENITSDTILIRLPKKTVRLCVNFEVGVRVVDTPLFLRSLMEEVSTLTSAAAKKFLAENFALGMPFVYEKAGDAAAQLRPQANNEFLRGLCEGLGKVAARCGVEVTSVTVNTLVVPDKLRSVVDEAIHASTNMAREINDFIKDDAGEVVLQKVGSEFLEDKTVEVYTGVDGQTKTEYLDVVTGDEAKGEVVYNKEMDSRSVTLESLLHGKGKAFTPAGNEGESRNGNEYAADNGREGRNGSGGASASSYLSGSINSTTAHPQPNFNKQNREWVTNAQTSSNSNPGDAPGFCTACGRRRNAGDLFCGGCGKKLQ